MPRKSRKLRILIACPASPGTQYGNRITALRWQSIFRELGHRTRIDQQRRGSHDVVIALHARRSADLIAESKCEAPSRPVVLAITGTDLYRDGKSAATQSSLHLADAIVVLQPDAIKALPRPARKKAHVIYQSVRPIRATRPSEPRTLRVIVAGHLRDVKDPFRAAIAVRNLPIDSKIKVRHLGGVIDAGMQKRAIDETKSNQRYRWYGEVPRSALKRQLAMCWMMVLSSKLEGGANVLSEAMVQHTPVLASRIPGSTGLLGERYAGYFDVGDTGKLRELLLRAEDDSRFYEKLRKQVVARAKLLTRKREVDAWRSLLRSL